MAKIINSEDNKKIKFIKSLKQKKFRAKESTYILEGIKPILEGIRDNAKIIDVFVSNSFFENELKNHKIPMELNVVNDKIFDKITDTVNSQGIIATVKAEIKDIEEIMPFGRYIFLDGLSDPGNMGGIIRGVDAFDFDGVILGPNCVDVLNEKVVRSTMGSIFRVNIYNLKNIDEVAELKKRKFRIIITTLHDESVEPENIDLKNNVIIVIGNEANGVTDIMKNYGNSFLTIPMKGMAESLNANVSGNILMYESNRQRD